MSALDAIVSRFPSTDRVQKTRKVAGVQLVRSGTGWRPVGTRIEMNYDEHERAWFIAVPGYPWFYRRTLKQAVVTLKWRKLIPAATNAAEAPEGES